MRKKDLSDNRPFLKSYLDATRIFGTLIFKAFMCLTILLVILIDGRTAAKCVRHCF